MTAHRPDPDHIAVLAAGLTWLYGTAQPPDAIVTHHGHSHITGDRVYKFSPSGLNDLPVVVVDVAHRRYDSEQRLLNPLDGPDEVAAVTSAVELLGRRVAETWNGAVGQDTASLGLADPPHPTLRGAVNRYRAGCPTHRTVFCGDRHDCPWLRDGLAAAAQPVWPELLDRPATS